VSVSEDGVARGEDNGGAMAEGEMWEVCSGTESLMLPPGIVGGEGTLAPLKVEEDFLWVQHHKILQTVALEEGGFGIDKILTMMWLLLDALHAKDKWISIYELFNGKCFVTFDHLPNVDLACKDALMMLMIAFVIIKSR